MKKDYEYSPTNREKSRRAVTGYNVCYDCEGQKPGGCKNCDWAACSSLKM